MPTLAPLRQRRAECGFDTAAFSTGDAAVAARPLARRWRELFADVADSGDDGESLLREPMSSGWSAGSRGGETLTAAHLVQEAIHEAAHHLRLARRDLAVACDVALDEEEAG